MGFKGKGMAQGDNDLDLKELYRLLFVQGGQVAIGTAIGMGVVLLVGIVAVFTAPIWLPIWAYIYWRKEKKRAAAGGQDVTDLVSQPVDSDVSDDADSDAGRRTPDAAVPAGSEAVRRTPDAEADALRHEG